MRGDVRVNVNVWLLIMVVSPLGFNCFRLYQQIFIVVLDQYVNFIVNKQKIIFLKDVKHFLLILVIHNERKFTSVRC